MLKSMQGVVMHKNADRPLPGQIIRGMIKHMMEMLAALGGGEMDVRHGGRDFAQ
jgi:hypothetical protein